MHRITRCLATRRARHHTERIATDFAGSPAAIVADSPYFGSDKTVFSTVLEGDVSIQVSWSSLMPLGMFSMTGLVLPDGASPQDEDSFRTFRVPEYDGVFGLRHAYHKATGHDLPR